MDTRLFILLILALFQMSCHTVSEKDSLLENGSNEIATSIIVQDTVNDEIVFNKKDLIFIINLDTIHVKYSEPFIDFCSFSNGNRSEEVVNKYFFQVNKPLQTVSSKDWMVFQANILYTDEVYEISIHIKDYYFLDKSRNVEIFPITVEKDGNPCQSFEVITFYDCSLNDLFNKDEVFLFYAEDVCDLIVNIEFLGFEKS